MTAVSGQQAYSLPDLVERPFRVVYDGYALFHETTTALDYTAEEWTARTGTPERWMQDRQGDRKLRIWPAPSTDGAGAVFSQNNIASSDTTIENGTVIDIDDSGGTDTFTFNQDIGRATAIEATDTAFVFNSEYGRVIDMEWGGDDIEVWAKERPLPLDEDRDEPRLPEWTQMAVVYRAAARALRADKESRSLELAAIYDELADDTAQHLRLITATLQPERVHVVRRHNSLRRRNLVRDTHVNATGIPSA